MRTALLFKKNNFVGREYFVRLCAAGRAPNVLMSVGEITSKSVAFEVERTGGKWNPPSIPTTSVTGHFETLADPSLWAAIADAEIDIVIQGGVGILKPEMISVPKVGIINVHPGRLPAYRGNSCPEWAIFNNDVVWATAHLVDAGIDTGPVICSRRYDIQDNWSYADFRSHLYEHCASVLIDALCIIERTAPDQMMRTWCTQDETAAKYYSPIPQEEMAIVIGRFPLAQKVLGAES